eukprot:1165209-Prymnesium_polylepis.1
MKETHAKKGTLSKRGRFKLHNTDDTNFFARFLRINPKGRCSLDVFPLNFEGALEVRPAPSEP